MIELLYGKAGINKQSLLFEKIKQNINNGQKAIVLVPEQQVFETERIISGMNINTLKIEVVGFRRLCNLIFREYGGLCYNYINNGAKLIIIWRIINELKSFLTEFKNIKSDDYSVLELLRISIEEFERCNVSPLLLQEVSTKINNSKLKSKLSDLSIIYEAVHTRISHFYDNPEEDINRAVELLRFNHFFNGRNVFIYGFTSFSKQEYSLIDIIIEQSDSIFFSVLRNKKDYSELFDVIKNTEKNIIKISKSHHKTICDDIDIIDENCKDDLLFLKNNFNIFPIKQYTGNSESIKVFETPNKYDDIQSVVTIISDMIQNGNYRYKDFAIISKNPSDYEGIIRELFGYYDIPYFISVRTDSTIVPEIKFIYFALSISKGWRKDDVISYIRTGLSGLDYYESDLLEKYVETWNINGKIWLNDWTMNPKGFSSDSDNDIADYLNKINSIRAKLVDPLTELFEFFETNNNVRNISEGLFNYLINMNIPSILKEKAEKYKLSGDSDQAQICSQTWEYIIKSLDDLVSVAGDMIVNSESYSKLLFSLFSSLTIGKIPSRNDEVIVGEPKILYRPVLSVVFILGSNDGEFPGFSEDNQMFTDSEKELLSEYGIDLPEYGDLSYSSKLYEYYRSITLSYDKLFIYYNSDKGESIGSRTVRKMFSLEPQKVSFDRLVDVVYNKKTAFNYSFLNKNDKDSSDLIKILSDDDEYKLLMNRSLIPIGEENGTVNNDSINNIFGEGINLTQARIDNYSKCPFSFYIKNILSIRPDSVGEFQANDVGDFIHGVLEFFFKNVDYKVYLKFEEKELENSINESIILYRKIKNFYSEDLRIEHLYNRLSFLALTVLKNIIVELKETGFVPVLFEADINNDKNNIHPLKIKTDNGKYISVYGRIDRVDILKSNDDLYVRIVDYKTGKKDFSIDQLYKGVDLQMPLYLITICKNGKEVIRRYIGDFSDIVPAGVIYYYSGKPKPEDDSVNNNVSLKKPKKLNGIVLDDKIVIENTEKNFAVSKKNILNSDNMNSILNDVTFKVKEIGDSIYSGKSSATPIKDKEIDACKYCEYHSICRIKESNGDD